MLIVAAGIALGTATVLWSTNTDYTALYADMPAQDTADIVAALEQNGIPYKINSSNGIVTVPADKVQQIRLQMANNGLPRSSSRGFDILEDDQGLGTSNFLEQARYNRALEQELVQTVKHIQGVRDARIHLSIPKQSSFIRNSNNPSASVMLDLVRLHSLSEMQLTGIVHLVASSVAGLKVENVSIIDQRGNLLSQRSNSEFSSSNENIRFTRRIEEDYSNRIIDILTPIVGAGNVRTQVSADIDFTFIETTEETYNPNAVVIRSEQTQQENSGSNGTSAVEPGALSSTPPAAGDASGTEQVLANSSNQTRTSSTRNYEIDRSVSLIRTVPGTINNISVAVLVDLHAENSAGDSSDSGEAADASNLDRAKIDRLTQLVKDTIGFNEARGDSVNVISERFFIAEEFAPAEETPFWQQAWFFSTVKQLGAMIVVIFLIFGVLRPAMKSVVSSQGNLPNRIPALPAGTATSEIADDQVSLSNAAASLSPPTPPGKSLYDQNLSLAQTLVQNEPARAARMIQNWLVSKQTNIRSSTERISKWETPCLTNTPSDGGSQDQSEEALKRSAYEQAHKEGYAAGKALAAEDMKQRLDTIDTFINALSHPFEEQNLKLAEYLAQLAGKIARSLVRRELRTDPETILALIRDAVATLNTSVQKINVHLNPENARRIREIINIENQEQNWNIIDDPLIAHGDCKVSNQDALIDADLKTRIDLIITQFLGDERQESGR